MTQKIIVVGAGIIGASTAYQLQKAGADVTVIDAGHASATRASFGWINASFFLDRDHFQLRADAIHAYQELTAELTLSVNWCGCLCFENTGAAFDQQASDLKAMGYPFVEIDAQAFSKLEPHVANPPDRALMFQQEAAADSGALADQLLAAAIARGARTIRGVAVNGFEMHGDRVTGIRTTAGVLNADYVVSAVGIATQSLMADVDVDIPMLTRPAVMVTTQPVAPILQHVLVTDIGEIRQLPNGALMLPAAISHQSDASEVLAYPIEQEADIALARLQALLPKNKLRWEQATLAYRPVPHDERPAVGQVRDGLYVACMHSGITLGALMGQQIAVEVTSGPSNETAQRLAPYRPDRFWA